MKDYCLLCLDANKDLLDSIDTNSARWQELGIKRVLEKHFWPLSSIEHPCSWICLACWQEVDNFHKFYLRIEEAHANFGRIKFDEESNPKEEITDPPFCLEPEILIDQNVLQSVADNKELSVKQEEDYDDINKNTIINTDPLKKSNLSKRKSIKNVKQKATNTTKNEQNTELPEIKEEPFDSENNTNSNSSDGEDSNYEPDTNSVEYKNRKEGDKFIAEHFKQMFCDLCEASFENFTAMKKHFLVIHSTRKGYLVCCNKKFFQRNWLVDHLQYHINPDIFKCNQCGKTLSDRKNLRAHMLRVHLSDDAVKHSCEVCGKSFPMAYLLRTHKLIHVPKEEKNFPCTHCGKFYASSYLLKLHTEVIHLNKQAKVCYICGKTLRTSTEYKAHMNKHAGVSAAINCDVCGLRLISERSLKLHKESQHPAGGKKDHPCHLCEKISPTARALKKHINTMHEKGLNYKCNLCEKNFRRAEALKEHMASHTGTPLYACPWCPKTFNSNGNMHAHRKNKHPKESLELRQQRYN